MPKISTTWSEADWKNALKKVWKLSRNFDEILEFGLTYGFITSSDIVNAANIYKDPCKEYADDEVIDVIRDRGIRDIVNILEDEYSCEEIIQELDEDDVLDCFNDETLYDKIENSGLMNIVKDEIRDETYHQYVDEWIDELKNEEKDFIENLKNANPDELHTFICNVIGCGYYDEKSIKEGLNKLKERLNKNCYNIKYT